MAAVKVEPAATIEEAVRQLGGMPDGEARVMRALFGMVVAAIEDRVVIFTKEQTELMLGIPAMILPPWAIEQFRKSPAGAKAQGNPFDPRAVVEFFLKSRMGMEEGHPEKIGRASDAQKVLLYSLMAVTAGPPADQFRRPPLEGYAIGALEALVRLRSGGLRTQQQLDQVRYAMLGQVKQAGAAPVRFEPLPGRPAAPSEPAPAPGASDPIPPPGVPSKPEQQASEGELVDQAPAPSAPGPAASPEAKPVKKAGK